MKNIDATIHIGSDYKMDISFVVDDNATPEEIDDWLMSKAWAMIHTEWREKQYAVVRP